MKNFGLFFLNNSKSILVSAEQRRYTGTLVDVRIVLKQLLKMATALILCHNHPSGTLVPSDADKHITKN
jgi:DNA repair protein RadC